MRFLRHITNMDHTHDHDHDHTLATTASSTSNDTSSTTSSRRSTLDATPPPIPSQIIVTFDGKVREIERIGTHDSPAENDKQEARGRSGSEGSRYYTTRGKQADVLERMARLADHERV